MRLRNDRYCVGWDLVKLYSHTLRIKFRHYTAATQYTYNMAAATVVDRMIYRCELLCNIRANV